MIIPDSLVWKEPDLVQPQQMQVQMVHRHYHLWNLCQDLIESPRGASRMTILLEIIILSKTRITMQIPVAAAKLDDLFHDLGVPRIFTLNLLRLTEH